MGVLNHGGLFDSADDAVARGLDLVTEGADLLDVGDDLPQLTEVIAVLAAHTRISIHTTDPVVAESALLAGATLVNDMSASLWPIAADAGAGWIAVHGAGLEGPTNVREWLIERATSALEGGVDEVWIDPGLGYGKSLRETVTLLGRIDELVATGIPVALATSRKRFVGALLAASDARAAEPALPGLVAPSLVEDADDEVMAATDDRVEGSLATAVFAMTRGVSLLRVHEVQATVNAVRLLTAEVAA
jgi:dihydropteroate synthase